jgi:hypothetical protein
VRLLFIALCFVPTLAFAKPTYEVKFVCSQIPNNTNVKTFSADTETQAILQARITTTTALVSKTRDVRLLL